MIRVLISTTLRPGADLEHYQRLDERMAELAKNSPGFLDATTWTDESGKAVSMVLFVDRSALLEWRNHPDHLEAQALGRSTFYSSYTVEVFERVAHYSFTASAGP